MTNVEKLSEKDFTKLLKFAENSPHRFILATSGVYSIPKPLKKECHLIRVGEVPPAKLFDSFTKLMSEPNRNLVRKILAQDDVNVELMLYILKDNTWKAKEVGIFHAVESCFRYLHKVSKEYIVSMLAFLYPVARLPLSFSKDKRKLYKDEKDILEKLRKRYRLPKFEALETFRAIKNIIPRQPELGSKLSQELKLNEKERKVLGIKKVGGLGEPVTAQKPVPSSSNLQKWF